MNLLSTVFVLTATDYSPTVRYLIQGNIQTKQSDLPSQNWSELSLDIQTQQVVHVSQDRTYNADDETKDNNVAPRQ